ITVFASLWAVPFLQLKLHCSLKVTSLLTSMILLGAGLSCPLFGLLSIRLKKRKPLIHASCLSTSALLFLALYLPTHNLVLIGFLMFGIGLCCGAYMLAYSISNELAPADSLSTCTGFTNTLAMLSAPLLQPLVGYILDRVASGPGVYTLGDYQKALVVIPVCLILASILVRFLPEK
ncbi:MAG: MFS transporter, partial [Legionellales bacterium]